MDHGTSECFVRASASVERAQSVTLRIRAAPHSVIQQLLPEGGGRSLLFALLRGKLNVTLFRDVTPCSLITSY